MPFAERHGRNRFQKPRCCCQRKPSSVRCSDQSAGSRDACRINFMALGCGGCRSLTMAAVMSGASQGRRSKL